LSGTVSFSLSVSLFILLFLLPLLVNKDEYKTMKRNNTNTWIWIFIHTYIVYTLMSYNLTSASMDKNLSFSILPICIPRSDMKIP